MLVCSWRGEMFIERDVLLLLFISSCVIIAVGQPNIGYNDKNQRPSSSRTASNSVKKSCRYTWEWETSLYGDLCLPAKSSLLPRKRTSSISRHKGRLKSKNTNDKSGSRSRHSKSRKVDRSDSYDFMSDAGLLMEGPPQYQMDAPKYLNMVSHWRCHCMSLCWAVAGCCGTTWCSRSNGYHRRPRKYLFLYPAPLDYEAINQTFLSYPTI